MLKNFSLMKRKEGMSLDEFRKWALEEHVELGKKIPGMLHYRMNVVLEENPATPDGISEMWFDSMDTRMPPSRRTPERQPAGMPRRTALLAPTCSWKRRSSLRKEATEIQDLVD